MRADSAGRDLRGALVFDFDGTLVDSGDIKQRAYTEAITAVTIGTPDEIAAAYRRHGTINRDPQLRAAYRDVTGSEADPATVKSMLSIYAGLVESERTRVSTFPGIVQLLAKHRPSTYLAIASNAPRTEVAAACETLEMGGYFDAIYGFPITKEDAINAVMSMQVRPSESVIYIGDRREDGEVAARVGVPFCRFGPLEPEGEPGVLRTAAQLESALAQVGR